MRKVILMLLLAVLSSSAMAEWVKVGANDKSTIYADPATIRKEGNMVKMWRLKNYGSPKVYSFSTNTVLSDREQSEYDCKEEQYRSLYISYHSEKYGKGEVVYRDTYPASNWRPVEPDSIGAELWKLACGKR